MNAAIRPNVNNTRPKTTQDLMIILIQRVKKLERELKARTPPIEIHKVDRGRSSAIKCSKAFPLLEHFATVSTKEFPLLSCCVATAEDFALLEEDNIYSQSKTRVSYSVI
nr:hypothetical protein [Tanacetum cinerariifolium]